MSAALGQRAKIALGVAGFAIVFAALWSADAGEAWVGLLHRLREIGPAAKPLFFLIYVTASVLCAPSTFLDLGAGAVFGVVQGSILVSAASLGGATVSFWIARHGLRDRLGKRLVDTPRFRRIDAGLQREGWKIVALARLSPFFPFWFLNYGFGLTRISLGQFVIATWLGMLPLVVAYVYAGAAVADLSMLGRGEPERGALEWAAYSAGLAATAALAFVFGRVARRTLEQGP